MEFTTLSEMNRG